MNKHPVLGWPIVTAENCFQVIRDAGIQLWPKINEQVPIEDFLKNAEERQLATYRKFAPKSFAIEHRNPFDGSVFDAFRVEFKPYALVIALIDDKYVAVTAEWKHGNNHIAIVPVCGVAGRDESHLPTLAEKMEATAIREWHEETGLELESVIPLSSRNGTFHSVRNSEARCFSFLGKVKPYTERGVAKFDSTEHLAMVLFPCNEWLKLLEDNSLFDNNLDFGLEDCARASTYVAFRKLGRLTFE